MWIAYAEALTMTFAPVERTRDALKKAMDLAADIDDVESQAGLLYLQWSLEFMSGHHGAALVRRSSSSLSSQRAAATP